MICGRAPSVVWATGKLLHAENSVPLPENHITGCTTGRSLMMKPRSAWPERNEISMPYVGRCGMSCAAARAAVVHARSASEMVLITGAFFLHRFCARAGEARAQHVAGIAVT